MKIVTATRVAGGMRIHNATDGGIAYSIQNKESLALLALCADPGPSCVRIAAGQTVVLPDSEFGGPELAIRSVTFWWWHVKTQGGGRFSPADPHQIEIAL